MNICKNCKKKLIIRVNNKELKKNYIFICSNCKKNLKLYDKKLFDSLKISNDLKINLKCIYSEDNNISYKESSINKILQKKIRKDLIKKKLSENKIEFRYHGDVYSFIHYNTPSIDKIINKLKKKQKNIINRKIKLHLELKKKGIPLDMEIRACYDYIYNLGNLDLKKTVKEIEIELFLKKIPEYKNLLVKYNKNYAIKLALKNYKADKKEKKIVDKIKNVLVRFD